MKFSFLLLATTLTANASFAESFQFDLPQLVDDEVLLSGETCRSVSDEKEETADIYDATKETFFLALSPTQMRELANNNSTAFIRASIRASAEVSSGVYDAYSTVNMRLFGKIFGAWYLISSATVEATIDSKLDGDVDFPLSTFSMRNVTALKFVADNEAMMDCGTEKSSAQGSTDLEAAADRVSVWW